MLSRTSFLRRIDAFISLAAFLLLAAAIVIAFSRGLNTPFIFDDLNAIQNNPSIVRLWPLIGSVENPGPLNPPKDWTTAGRPLVNLTLALNYHFGGLDPGGYHVCNLLIHLFSTLLLGSIVARTLRLQYFGGSFASASGPLAFLTALMWGVHPLLSETVVYTIQRTELLVGLFYLATLYCSLRYWTTTSIAGSRSWLVLALLSSLAGMACKEVMVTAPVVVLLFERTFIAGSFRQALQRSWPLYTGLAFSWLLLVGLNYDQPRASSAGFNLEITPVRWWCMQAKVLWLYLELVVWPWPLAIHYSPLPVDTIGDVWPWILATAIFIAATIIFIWARYSVGFVGAWVLLILAPTLVVPIISEVAAERRMYLPLAALMTLVVGGSYWLIEQAIALTSTAVDNKASRRRAMYIVALATVFLVIVSILLDIHRLAAFQDPLLLWQATVDSQPDDSLAHNNLASEFLASGRQQEAIQELRCALRLKPDYFLAHINLGNSLERLGSISEAVEQYQQAIQIRPTSAPAYINLGVALAKLGRTNDAIKSFEDAVKYAPENGPAHRNLGALLLATGKQHDAIAHLQAALRLEPDQSADIHQYLGEAFLAIGDSTDAIQHLQEALRVEPKVGEIHETLAIAMAKSGRLPEAIEQFEQAVLLDKDNAQDYKNLAIAYAQLDRINEAVVTAEKSLALARLRANTEMIQETEGLLKQYRMIQKGVPDGRNGKD
jgi:protein O-mannosyl-transferase